MNYFIIDWSILKQLGLETNNIHNVLRGFGFKKQKLYGYNAYVERAFKIKHYTNSNVDKLNLYLLKYGESIIETRVTHH